MVSRVRHPLPPLLVHGFDHLFWFGDLNYRIDLPRESVLKLVANKDWRSLRYVAFARYVFSMRPACLLFLLCRGVGVSACVLRGRGGTCWLTVPVDRLLDSPRVVRAVSTTS